jgi:hypothetical protein
MEDKNVYAVTQISKETDHWSLAEQTTITEIQILRLLGNAISGV